MMRFSRSLRVLLGCLPLGCNVGPVPGDADAGGAPEIGRDEEPEQTTEVDASSDRLLELTDPSMAFPEALSDVGIYQALDSTRPVPAALSYTPRAELWSNGLEKARLLVLPRGETIDPRRQPWRFPTGTLFFKTFSGLDGPVETRILRNTGAAFEYVSYQWIDGDARRLDGRVNVELDVRTGAGRTKHTIPSHLTCGQCHESGDSQVLGFQPIQLWDGRVDQERSFHPSPVLVDPLEPGDETQRVVLDYFVGNCVHCHNGGTGLASSYDLRPDVAFRNVINQPTEGNASAPGIRVVPGEPIESVLFRALSGEGDTSEVKDMPPEGVQLRDARGIELFRTWIEGLEEPPGE